MNRRRVGIFCEKWESGGIESFLNNILLQMDLSEMEVDIVAACVKESVFASGLRERGVRFIELSGKLRSPKNHRLFRQLLRERKYDVVHFNLFQGLSLCYVQIARKENIPVRIAHSHGSNLRNCLTKKIKLLLHKTGRTFWGNAATEYWACSSPAADFLFGERTFSFIPNGIDVERFCFCNEAREKVRRELGLSEEIVVGTVGRLSPEKNQSFLLSVFQKFHLEYPNSVLLLVGDGAEKGFLMEQAAHQEISDCVVFYGSSQRVNELLCAMDVFVFPSLFEGLPLAAVEAQASGLPVLCSEGIPQEAHISDSIKALPFDNELAWVNEIVNMLNTNRDRADAVKWIGQAGFAVQTVAEKIHKKYMGKSNA